MPVQELIPFIGSGVAPSLSSDTAPTSAGSGQGLYLSLSSRQPSSNPLQFFSVHHPEPVMSSCEGLNERFLKNDSKTWTDKSFMLIRASNYIINPGSQDQLAADMKTSNGTGLSASDGIDLWTSKYLKPAQQLLDEVVSVVKGNQNRSANQLKAAPGRVHGLFGEGYEKEENLAETSEEDGGNFRSKVHKKDGILSVTAVPMSASGAQGRIAQNMMDPSSTDRKEWQIKKAKLLAMVDEVDQRYRLYIRQMQNLEAPFQTIVGLGAAKAYTALASQTISKHFRCLKDAMKVQLQAVCKTLGEEVDLEHDWKERSGLLDVDKELYQHHALQHLGIIQQHPWRPQRGLPERSVSVLRAWLFEHFLHPYPKDSDKVRLARQTGLTRNQVSNWFINARVRLWKPMVEEMYTEVKNDKDLEKGNNSAKDQDGESKAKVLQCAAVKNLTSRSKQEKVSDLNTQPGLERRKKVDEGMDFTHRELFIPSSHDNLSLQKRQIMTQPVKRVRSDLTSLQVKSHALLNTQMSTGRRTESSFGMHSQGLQHSEGFSMSGPMHQSLVYGQVQKQLQWEEEK
ncbi:hypothetical protein KP509_39G018400 [Ceratopteris richardii]|uniref:Homeobox domain-containing protein n=1 Tax=Ceratopteris richardii TaxID=49495 RepID=A0A8T2PYR9_CERRI|nr:hypothetical protein KP509_39G018400 [Ceratopteris richardii]